MKLKRCLLFILLMSTSKFALAVGCSFTPKDIKITIPDLIVSPNQEIGSVIAARSFPAQGRVANCLTGGSPLYKSTMMGNWATESAIKGIYETGIPGIGVRIDDYIVDSPVPTTQQIPPVNALVITAKDIKMLFYRIGEIKPGSFPAGPVAHFQLTDTKGSLADLLTLRVTGGGVKIKSCYAKSPNIIVPMNQVQRKVFTGPGSLSPAKAFSLDMVCQNDAIAVDVSFDVMSGITSPGPGIVPLTDEENAASGVAIKVMNNDGTPLVFNNPVRYHNQYEREISIPLKAAYIQTANIIKAGVANAAITFTITQN